MNPLRVAFLALVFAGASLAQARPVVIEESATITRPNASWQTFGRFVAIDGDNALVSGERLIEDPAAEGGFRQEYVAFLYRRLGASWSHIGRLGPVSTITNWREPGFAMKNGIAVTRLGITRIFERQPSGTWAQMPLPPDLENNLQGPDIEIDGGRILIARKACGKHSVVLRKINGAWAVEGELTGNSSYCTAEGSQQDIQGTHAMVHNSYGLNGETERVIFYELNGNGVGWRQTTHAEGGIPYTFTGQSVPTALNWPNWATASDAMRGTAVGYHLPGDLVAWANYGLQPVDSWLTPQDNNSTNGIERFRDLFLQRNWSYDRQTYVVNLFRVNDDAARSSEQVGTLRASDGAYLGAKFDSSGNRVIVSGWSNGQGSNSVRVFDVPPDLEAPAVQVHDFDLASAGAAWQPAAGSSFSVVRVANTGVYRQASTAGTPSSSIPSSNTTNQAIQAEVTPRATNGPNAWVGLTTRRSDDSNYYYVTLRASGTVELKRLVNGAITNLASAPADFNVGQKHRLRLESIGTLHRVYVDDVLVLSARDATLSAGTAGVITNRASADFDNVIVTPSPFTTIDTHFITETNIENSWTATSGAWSHSSSALHQSSLAGYARNITGATTDDQIFQASIRPTGFAGPDNWVGLMARYLDDNNYLYVSLRARGVISLWRRQSGALTQLAQIRYPFGLDTWYTMRVEVVGERTRVYMNDVLLLSSNAAPGPDVPNVSWSKGQVGLITYGATADFTDVLVYQP